MEIYEPAEDSILFENFLKEYLSKNKVNSYLDMGTGSGILSVAANEYLDKQKILAIDINLNAVKLVKSKGINATESNLFEKIDKKFDLITFNAPYLPLDKREPIDSRLATTGGINGDEISIKFLKQAKSHLTKNGKVFLLISSLTPMEKIKKFNPKIVKKSRVFTEDLIILEFDFK